jgi:8-oxo-dGTP diphosphatase
MDHAPLDSGETTPTIRVVAAALFDAQGRILIAERLPGSHMAGRWEFPGGKMHAGESEWQALVRELDEELGIEVRSGQRLLEIRHQYPQRNVELAMWRVTDYRGRPHGREGQELRWVAPDALHDHDLLEADRPIVEFLLAQSPA